MERPLAVLASGSGSTAAPLFEFTRVVISSLGQAKVLNRVREYNDKLGREAIATEVVRVRDYESMHQWGDALIQRLLKHDPRFVSLNGWSLLLPESVTQAFPNRIVNSHPGPLDFEHRLLLPDYLGEVDENTGRDPLDFGGWKMHGRAVHEAVRAYAELTGQRRLWTEVTLHLLDPSRYDNGPTVARSRVRFSSGDDAEGIQYNVKEVEKLQNKAFWRRAVDLDELPILERQEPLIPERRIGQLWQARAKGKFAYPLG